MTAKQAQVWDLYASGHRVTDIAKALGRSKGAVSTTIKAIKQRLQAGPPERVSIPCVYSPSCFTCPMGDCVVEGADVNAI